MLTDRQATIPVAFSKERVRGQLDAFSSSRCSYEDHNNAEHTSRSVESGLDECEVREFRGTTGISVSECWI